MLKRINHITELFLLAVIAIMNGTQACWAGPPGPPTIPATPVGGTEVTIATVIAVAGYGYWKSRK